MTSSRKATRPYHHGQLRDSLVQAGLDLARAGGPEAVVLRAVSRTAGVSHNAAYRHFADHQELLGAVGERCMAELAALMDERTTAVRLRGRVPRAWARLEAIGRAYIEFAVAEPGWFRTAFAAVAGPPTQAAPADEGEPPPDPTPPAATSDVRDPYALLSARLDELVEVGAIPPARRPNAEDAAWSMVHGLSTLLVDGPLQGLPPAEVDRAITTVLGVVSRGL